MNKTIQPREPVLWFAQQMEKKLRENDDMRGSRGWKECNNTYLLKRLEGEYKELLIVCDNFRLTMEVLLKLNYELPEEKESKLVKDSLEKMISESADIANFAMMVADNCRARLKNRGCE